MKQLSSMELHFLVKDLQSLLNKRIEKIYQLEKEEFLFQIQGKQLLRIVLPSFMFLTDTKPDMPEKPSDFCMVLRKYLQNSRILEFCQLKSERILFLKTQNATLIIELFSKGNLILTVDDKIKSALIYHKYSQRTLRGGIPYEAPKPRTNIFEITESEFNEIIKTSNKESIVKTLALDLGIGGLFAEELCLRAGIDKDSKNDDSAALYGELQKLLKSKIEPKIVENDVIPFSFKLYKEAKDTPSYARALSTLYLPEKKESANERKIRELSKILDSQNITVSEIKTKIKDTEDKAKYIYSHYNEIYTVLELAKELKKKKQLKDIDSKLIKGVNEKEGKIVIEI